MTLFKQINSLLFALFLLVMSSLVYFQFTQTKAFMENQIESDLNNTAHALTLMLQPHIESGDIVAAETVVNVIFEGGFYQKVKLNWLATKEELLWENSIQVRGVPQWFIELDLFATQSMQTTITNGWMQLATLEIEANPAFGYKQLWRVMNDTLMTLSGLFILSIVLLRVRLNRILRPLHRVAEQAKLIAKREFQPELDIPQTAELKEVVLAINSMSGQLKDVFKRLDKEVVTLKNEKLTDSVSQLPNRLFLNAQLESWLKEPGYGGLMIARLDWLEDVHLEYGFQIRDQTIHILAKEFAAELHELAPSVIARISNVEFAFLVTKASSEQLSEYLKVLLQIIKRAMSEANCKGVKRFYIGVSARHDKHNVSALLGEADKALQQAIQLQKESYTLNLQMQTDQPWQKQLTQAINKHHFVLQLHPALSFESAVLHHEIYCQLRLNDEVVRAAQFMPKVEMLELGSIFDRELLYSIEAHPELIARDQAIAINITHDSVKDRQFHQWLRGYLQRQKQPNRLNFELPEISVISSPKQTAAFVELIKELGGRVGVDNCGRKMGSLAYLQEIKPNYVKLDQSLSCNQETEMEVGQLDERIEITKAVVNTARGLGVEVIITGVETESQLMLLKTLHATGYQGFITKSNKVSL